jgi:hypothetical protein
LLLTGIAFVDETGILKITLGDAEICMALLSTAEWGSSKMRQLRS